ncbi:MAG: hypothetical protein LBH85_03875 [Treponema sp.]|jgi:hypothetical protein|nr:hypothetical protein [Treponema sp.]
MANDKKSSIYDDQNGAGLASDLDEYGVWVKSDPAKTSGSEKEDDDFLIPDLEISEIEELSADELDLPMIEDIDDFGKEFIPEDLENDPEDLDALSFDTTLDPELDDIEELQVEDILKADPDFLAMETQKLAEVPTIDALSFGDEEEEIVEPAFPAFELSALDEPASGESAFEDGVSGGEFSQTDADGENIAVSEEAFAPAENVDETGATELFIEDFLDDSPFDDDEISMEEDAAETEELMEAEPVPAETEEGADESIVPDVEAASAEEPVEAELAPAETEEDAEEAIASAGDVASAEEPVEAEPALTGAEEDAGESIASAGDVASVEEPVEAEPAITGAEESAEESIASVVEAASAEEPVEAEVAPTETEEDAEESIASAGDVASAEEPVEAELAPAEPEEVVDESSASDMDAAGGAGSEKPTAQPVTQTNLSTELLLRIAEELSSIRQELSTLKQDFLAIRASEPEVHTIEPVENPPEAEKKETAPQSAQGGFFDDSDDEKIALTGNELDNILLSADFTEEIGTDISKSEPESAEIEAGPEKPEEPRSAQGGFFDDSDDEKIALTGKELDNVLMSAEFIEETGEDLSEGVSEAAEIERDLETLERVSFEIEEVVLDPSTDAEELRWLREEGVAPITPAPEDSSYLEMDPAAHHELAVEDIDLSDVVIDEPDLSGQLQENPLQEPVLEAIAFDDMPLNLSDDALPADIDATGISGLENAGEEPLDSLAEPVVEEYPVAEPLPSGGESVEPPAEPVMEEYPATESLPSGEESVDPLAVEPVVEEAPPAESLSAGEESEEPAGSAAVSAEPAPEVEPVAKLAAIPSTIQQELKTVLSYMDQLLESLPEEKIEEFAASKYFDTYKKLFSELGLV